MEDALRATNNRILVKLAYSYGPVIDGWLKQRDRPTMVTADENVEMLRQIHLGVADAFVIAEEEATGLIQRSGLPPDNLEFLRFADAPPGEFRYIMCSHMVPPRVMQKLDAAINFKSR